MTLIVARIDENKVHVTSDTLLSKVNGERLPYDQCIIKCILVNVECCVCFAGNFEPANEAIANLISSNYGSVADILNYLISVHNKYNQSVDFGVITNISKKVEFYSIKSGEVKSNISSFWLGEKFNEFQKRLASINDNGSISSKMKDSLQSIIQDGNITGVGGFQISLSSDDENFQFEDKSGKRKVSGFSYDIGIQHNIGGPVVIEFKKAGEPQKIGGVSEDNISIFSSISPYYPGVAIHYMHAQVGYLFCPHLRISLNQTDVALEPIIFNNVTPKVFLNKIREKHNIDFKGFIADNDGKITYTNSLQ